jgi:hypothetical protein
LVVARLLREPPETLQTLMNGFYQDFELDVARHGSWSDAVVKMPKEWLSEVERLEAAPVIALLAREASGSELKGLLKRSGASWFFDAKSAKQVFEIWARALEEEK